MVLRQELYLYAVPWSYEEKDLGAQKNPVDNHWVSVENVLPAGPGQILLCHIGRHNRRIIEVPVRRGDDAFHLVFGERLGHDIVSANIQNLGP
jgi:hypothetical protein